ncbi:MAG: hypothetical protein ACJ765_07055 [Chloroflexota bacterium]
MHGPSSSPARTTIDFRRDLHPSRAWILGEDVRDRRRLEVIVIGASREAPSTAWFGPPAAESSECHCPDFCERDHANE